MGSNQFVHGQVPASNVHMTGPFQRTASAGTILDHFAPFTAPPSGHVRVDNTAFHEEMWRREKENDSRKKLEEEERRRESEAESYRVEEEVEQERRMHLENKSDGYVHLYRHLCDEVRGCVSGVAWMRQCPYSVPCDRQARR